MGGRGNGSSGLYLKASCGVLIIALLLHIIGIASSRWASTDMTQTDREEHLGLWKYCTYPYGGGESCNDFVDIIHGDWLKAAQAFMVLGLFMLPAAVGVVAMCAFVPDYGDDMRVLGAAMGVTAVAGLFTLCCVCSFGDRYQEYFRNKEPDNWAELSIGKLDWGFGITVADLFLTFVSLGLTIASLSSN